MEKILERVKKLMALAGNNPSEAEASAAMAKAHAILAEHNLTLNDLPEEKVSKPEVHRAEGFYGFPWARSIAQAIAHLYFCEMFFYHAQGNKKTTFCFVGKEHNTRTAAYVAQHVINAVMRESHKVMRAQGGGNSVANSFQYGASGRIGQRCRELIAAAKQGNLQGSGGANLPALAPLYNQEQEANRAVIDSLSLKTGKARQANIKDYAGYQAGRSFGDRVQLTQSVKGGASTKAIL